MKNSLSRFLSDFRQQQPRAIFCTLTALLTVHAVLVAWSATQLGPTVDEPFHLVAGIRRLKLGRFDLDRGNPPLVGDMAGAVVMLAEPNYNWQRAPKTFQVGRDFLRANPKRSIRLITLGRWALLPISLLGACVCYLWASELFGRHAGLMASAMWCFSPNILAAAPLITGDIAAYAFGLSAGYTTWRWLRAPTWVNCFWAGIALGMALISKYVWVLLLILVPTLFLLTRIIKRMRGETNEVPISRQVMQLCVVMVLAIEVVTIAYHGKWLFRPLGQFNVGERIADHTPAPVAELVRKVPVPFPEMYLRGIDEVAERDQAKPRSYLNGEWREGGFRTYYLIAALYKLPLGFWGLIVAATLFAILRLEGRGSWQDEFCLLSWFVVTLAFVSFVTVGQRFRYGYPAFVFLMIYASRLAVARLPSETGRMSSIRRCFASGAVGLMLLESLWVYPHSLSFFNLIAGGPTNGHHHLIDSNLDWGQELINLQEWVEENPQAEPLHIAYFGVMSPEALGVEFTLPPKFYDDVDRQVHVRFDKQGPLPGWHIVSVNYLHGTPWAVPTGEGRFQYLKEPYFTYFEHFEPVDRIGYGLHVYHLTADDVNPVRQELGLPPVAEPQSSIGSH